MKSAPSVLSLEYGTRAVRTLETSLAERESSDWPPFPLLVEVSHLHSLNLRAAGEFGSRLKIDLEPHLEDIGISVFG
jgi:hypothetical protein